MIKTELCVGVDGCKGGWIAVFAHCNYFNDACAVFVDDIWKLKDIVSKNSQIIVDIPIGLENDRPHRLCDELGRKYLGRRRSTLFSPPCIEAMRQKDYHTAKVVNKNLTGLSFSKQSWFLKEKIMQARKAISKGLYLKEGHPECSFTAYKGDVPLNGKKSLKGILERLTCVQEIGFDAKKIADSLVDTQKIKIDDLLDAIILCWTAARVSKNKHFTFPPDTKFEAKKIDNKIFV